MSDTLVGVIIGGLIASVLPAATLAFQVWRWKHERHLKYLKSERRRLEELFNQISNPLSESMESGTWDSRIWIPFLVHGPESVHDQISKMLGELALHQKEY